jgi:hypothetical protein
MIKIIILWVSSKIPKISPNSNLTISCVKIIFDLINTRIYANITVI